MVSVHQLFSDELPDEDLALGSVLEKRRRLLQRRQRRSLLGTFPKPHLGFSDDLDVAPHILEATVEQASLERAKASRRLRAALLRNGAVTRSSTRSPTRWGTPCLYEASEASVPAVFPFPEPIPQEIPQRRSPTPVRYTPVSARTSPTPGEGRNGSPIPSGPSVPPSRPSSRASHVPAVFPFPEPIPHEVPRRPRRAGNPSTTADTERKLSTFDEGAKSRVHDPAFVAEQKRIANGWIQETAPQPPGNKRHGAMWLILKKEVEIQRQRQHAAFRNMPCMPFDVWLLMKDEEDIATASGQKVEPPEAKEERKLYYHRLGRQRRQMLLGLSVHESAWDDDEHDRFSREGSFRPGSKDRS